MQNLKSSIASFYGKNSLYLDIILRFIGALVTFLWIRTVTGSTMVTNMFLLLVLSLLCSVLPGGATAIATVFLLAGQAFSLGLDIGAVTVMILLVVLIFFLRFAPDTAGGASYMAVLSAFGLSALVPLIGGVRKKNGTIAAVLCGTVFYFLTTAVGSCSDSLSGLELSNYAERLNIFLPSVFSMRFFVLMIAAGATAAIVLLINAMGSEKGGILSVIIGSIFFLGFYLIGGTILGVSSGMAQILIGTVVSCVLAFLFEELSVPVNRAGTEAFQIEDNHYVYYVKAVPKTAAADRWTEPDEDADMRIVPENEPDVPNARIEDVENVNYEKKLEDSLRDL
ncbi:MAG: hypothetical protein Q4B15_06550 [Lachnospiraceae bacterium]|nr:hypothetical protein [Lachnospiraceae bacterium]